MKCQVCEKETLKNEVVCSEHCGKVRQTIFDLKNKYTHTHGCSNCWGDLHGDCTEKCKEEFFRAREFDTDLWSLVKTLIQD